MSLLSAAAVSAADSREHTIADSSDIAHQLQPLLHIPCLSPWAKITAVKMFQLAANQIKCNRALGDDTRSYLSYATVVVTLAYPSLIHPYVTTTFAECSSSGACGTASGVPASPSRLVIATLLLRSKPPTARAAMIGEYSGLLATKRIVLASQSPRRREILTLMGLPFVVEVSSFEENLDKASFSSPADYVQANALGKALEVASRPDQVADLIIGCDTVVVLDGRILEKPTSEGDALKMLRALRGRSHTVVSGVAMFTPGPKPAQLALFSEKTEVHFADLSDATIEAYIRTGEPMDKAGAYGIQGFGGAFIKKVWLQTVLALLRVAGHQPNRMLTTF
jgi:septum formation protein